MPQTLAQALQKVTSILLPVRLALLLNRPILTSWFTLLVHLRILELNTSKRSLGPPAFLAAVQQVNLSQMFQRKREVTGQEFSHCLIGTYGQPFRVHSAFFPSNRAKRQRMLHSPLPTPPSRALDFAFPYFHITSVRPCKLPCLQPPPDLLSSPRSEPSAVAPAASTSSLPVPASLRFFHTHCLLFFSSHYLPSSSSQTALC